MMDDCRQRDDKGDKRCPTMAFLIPTDQFLREHFSFVWAHR
jgi:hypothetical protein